MNALVIFIAVLIIIAIVRSRLAADSGTSHSSQSQHTTASNGTTVESLMQAGRKIEAIKLYRAQTGAGLADAKDAVEAMLRGELNSTLSHTPAPSRDVFPDVVSLMHVGQKIQAIKLYREHTGVGLAEAKNAVEAMADGTFMPSPVATAQSADVPTLENLIRSGRKIEAIKIYRQQTSLGLKEAKDYIDALEQQLLKR